MNRAIVNLRTLSRISERGLNLYARFNEQCPSELHILAEYYSRCQEVGIFSRSELDEEEQKAYERVSEVLALEGAKPLVSELLFMMAQYGHGAFGLSMALLTLPTARIVAEGGNSDVRKEIRNLLTQIIDQNDGLESNFLRTTRTRFLNITLNTTSSMVDWLGRATRWTTHKAEGATQLGLRNLSRIGYTQPYIAYCLGWYAFNYENAINQHLIDSVQSSPDQKSIQVMSEAEERAYLFRHTKLSLARILNSSHTTNDLAVVISYLTWVEKNVNQCSNEEKDLIRAIERIVIPQMRILHKAARSDDRLTFAED